MLRATVTNLIPHVFLDAFKPRYPKQVESGVIKDQYLALVEIFIATKNRHVVRVWWKINPEVTEIQGKLIQNDHSLIP